MFQYDYAKGSKERQALLAECEKYIKADYKPIDIPTVVNGKEVWYSIHNVNVL
jgi:hypothetical protein